VNLANTIIEIPGDMFKFANGYAMVGLPELLALLDERQGDTALDYLSEVVEGLLRTAKAA
jgi:hypothetical protein